LDWPVQALAHARTDCHWTRKGKLIYAPPNCG
jgi:hypothetical protein